LVVEKAADLKGLKLEELKGLFEQRFKSATEENYNKTTYLSEEWEGQKRDSFERRDNIAFLLLAVSQMRKPDGSPVNSQMWDRAQVVSGLIEFAQALQDYSRALRLQEERLAQAIQLDRDGYTLVPAKDQAGRTPGFVDQYQGQIQQMKQLADLVRKMQGHLKDTQDQRDRANKLFEERDTQMKSAMASLQTARLKTAQQMAELRRYQEELFQAQRSIAEAIERTEHLQQEIREAEKR